MDDLEPLRDFRSGGPDLDETTKARIHGRVFDSTIDLRAGGPDSAGAADQPVDGVPVYAPDPSPPPRRPLGRWVAVAAAAALVILVLGVTVSVRRQAAAPDLATPLDADQRLAGVAAAARAQPDAALADGQFAFVNRMVRTAERSQTDPNAVAETHERIWLDDANGGWSQQTVSIERDGVTSTEPNQPTRQLQPQALGGYFGGLSYTQLRDLSAEPAALEEQVRHDIGIDDTQFVPSTLAGVLEWPSMPPASRKAAIELLAARGRSLGPTRDHNGREGVGLAVPASAGGTIVFVFNATTGGVLGTYVVPAGRELQPQNATEWSTVLDSGLRRDHG